MASPAQSPRATARRRAGSIVYVVGLVVALAACGDTTTDVAESPAVPATESGTATTAAGTSTGPVVAIDDAWARLPAMGQTVAAAYMTVRNVGDAPLTLLGVTSEIAVTELHETLAGDDGVMQMRERAEGFEIEPGAALVMEPGGAHVMLFDVDRDEMLMAGEVKLDLDLGEAGLVSVVAEVRDPGATGDMDHGDMGSGDMDHGDMGSGEIDHGDMGSGDMDHGDMPVGEPDVDAMHELDDELHADIYEPERQRAVVAEFRTAIMGVDGLDPEQLDALMEALDRLDTALEAGDVETAAATAFEVHDIAHGLVGH